MDTGPIVAPAKATKISLFSLAKPQMRTFHMT